LVTCSYNRWRRGKRKRRGQPDGARRQENISGHIWLCDDRSSPHVEPGQHPSLFNQMRATGKPGATRSLIERSEFVDWCLVVRRVCFCVRHGQLVSREHIAQNEPAPRACAILPHQFWGLARAVSAFLKTGPPCHVCPCSPLQTSLASGHAVVSTYPPFLENNSAVSVRH
jgi:hypothetical protein